MALIRPSFDLRQFSFRVEGSTYKEKSRNAFVSCWLCVCCVIVWVWCHVLQWKHPGLQRRWSQVRTTLPEPPIKRSGGSGKGKQRVGWQPPIVRGRWWGALLQVAGHIFSYFAYVHNSDAAQ